MHVYYTTAMNTVIIATTNQSTMKYCKQARHLHDIAHIQTLKSGSGSDWSSYRSLRNKVNSILRSAKAAHFSDLASLLRSRPGKFWRYFKSLSRHSKLSSSDVQLSVAAVAFTNHFCQLHTGLLLM